MKSALSFIFMLFSIPMFSQCDSTELERLQKLYDRGRINMEEMYEYKKLKELCADYEKTEERISKRKTACEELDDFLLAFPSDALLDESQLLQKYRLEEKCKTYTKRQIEMEEEFINPDGYTSVEVSAGMLGLSLTKVEIVKPNPFIIKTDNETATQSFVAVDLTAPLRNASFTFKFGGSYLIANDNFPEMFLVRGAVKFYIK